MDILRDNQWSETFRNPSAHFHLDHLGADLAPNINTIQLYTVEDVLWELPILGRGVDFTDGPDGNVIFANDSSLPTDQGFHPVREILERPAMLQLRKLGSGALMYFTLIVLGLGLTTHSVNLFKGVLPLRWPVE